MFGDTLPNGWLAVIRTVNRRFPHTTSFTCLKLTSDLLVGGLPPFWSTLSPFNAPLNLLWHSKTKVNIVLSPYTCWSISTGYVRVFLLSLSLSIYIYIYIYTYMDEYVWASLCVRGWVAKEDILSPASLKQLWILQKTFLCLYWREDHIKSCARENLLDRKRRTKDISQSGVEGQSVRTESQKVKPRTRTRWVSIFGCCIGFSLSYCDSYKHTSIEW